MNTSITERIVEPYLFFGGRCEEALEFYRGAIGAEVRMLMRFKDSPEPNGCPADWADKIMHANVAIGETTIMVSDGCWTERCTSFKGFALSLSVAAETEAARRFSALAEGGEIKMPLAQTFFAQKFGMLTDRFGVSWMVLVPAEQFSRSARTEAMAR